MGIKLYQYFIDGPKMGECVDSSPTLKEVGTGTFTPRRLIQFMHKTHYKKGGSYGNYSEGKLAKKLATVVVKDGFIVPNPVSYKKVEEEGSIYYHIKWWEVVGRQDFMEKVIEDVVIRAYYSLKKTQSGVMAKLADNNKQQLEPAQTATGKEFFNYYTVQAGALSQDYFHKLYDEMVKEYKE